MKRLSRIEVKYNASTKRLYSFSYETGASGRSSRLKTVQECGASTDNCLAPTQFTWTGGTPSFQSAQSVSATTYPLHLIDVDGDARDDLVYVSTTSAGGTWRIRKASASGGFDSEINTGLANTSSESALPLEWDGDGRIDLLVPYSGNHWWVFRSNGAGFDAPFDTGLSATGGADFTRTVDINGDGRHDLLRVSSVRAKRSSGFAIGKRPTSAAPRRFCGTRAIQTFDSCRQPSVHRSMCSAIAMYPPSVERTSTATGAKIFSPILRTTTANRRPPRSGSRGSTPAFQAGHWTVGLISAARTRSAISTTTSRRT